MAGSGVNIRLFQNGLISENWTLVIYPKECQNSIVEIYIKVVFLGYLLSLNQVWHSDTTNQKMSSSWFWYWAGVVFIF